jgi:Raf kinase inhibitor-like YbhB/YbcL family protein
MRKTLALTLMLTLAGAGAACAQPIRVTSPAFDNGAPIPKMYSAYADNHSPPLAWTAVPGAKAYALTLRDPDVPSGPFTHWLVWNIPGNVTALPQDGLHGVVLGKNDLGRASYFGPRPPSGTHHYHFDVFALDAPLDLASGADVHALDGAMKGHVLAKGELIGTYTP